jgi:hypothetical protein
MTDYIKVVTDVLSSPFVTFLAPVFVIVFGWRLLPLMSAPVRIFVLACLLTVSCYVIFDTGQGRDGHQWMALINRFH